MKAKYIIGGLFMAILGAAIALFAYTRIVDKEVQVVAGDSSLTGLQEARPVLTSFQMQEGQVDFSYAAEQTVHAVVHVRTKTKVGQPENPFMEYFFGERYSRPREVSGYGSGVIMSPDGYIITNNHVIEDADNIEVKLNDNRIFMADLVGRDPNTDLALLKIKAEKLSYLKYGDSDKLKIGEWVLAVGNPFNLTSTVTAGIVSAKGRDLGLLLGNEYRIESFIQTDAALNVGNSGGALVDTRGLLVGITSAIYSPSGAYAGNSFAIPVSIVRKVIDDLRQFGEVQRAIIGVDIRDVLPEEAEKQRLPEVKGATITNVREGGAAEEANLKPEDIVVKFNGAPVGSASELQEQITRRRPGDKSTITYVRNGKEITVPITLKNVAGNTNVVTKGMGAGNLFGARFESITSNDRRTFNIENGVKIVEVSEGWFRDQGLKKGTIIVNVNGKKVNSTEDIRSATGNNERSLKSIEGVTPDGRYFNFKFGY